KRKKKTVTGKYHDTIQAPDGQLPAESNLERNVNVIFLPATFKRIAPRWESLEFRLWPTEADPIIGFQPVKSSDLFRKWRNRGRLRLKFSANRAFVNRLACLVLVSAQVRAIVQNNNPHHTNRDRPMLQTSAARSAGQSYPRTLS